MTPSTRQTWVFQANPKRYDIRTSVAAEEGEYWNVLQHAHQVTTGDRVLIWISGPEAGIYAIGTVLSNPNRMPDSAQGTAYWTDESEGEEPRPRVLVSYDRVLDRPLLRSFLKTDAVLSQMKVIISPRGTNFPVTDEEWAALKTWLGPADV